MNANRLLALVFVLLGILVFALLGILHASDTYGDGSCKRGTGDRASGDETSRRLLRGGYHEHGAQLSVSAWAGFRRNMIS